MKPIGLRFKNQKPNPYTGRISGELMIIHQCISCGRISSNRIVGDDNPKRIVRLLEESKGLNKRIIYKLENIDIKLLAQKDRKQVLTTLYGHDYEKYTR